MIASLFLIRVQHPRLYARARCLLMSIYTVKVTGDAL